MRKVLFLILLLLCFPFLGCSNYVASNDCVFQISTINALIKGCYDSNFTLSELCRNGDTGIGTFNELDGEMVLDCGSIYQIKSDGNAYLVNDLQRKTPFASAVFFKPDLVFDLPQGLTLKEIQKEIELRIESKNTFYAIRIQGDFDYVKTRSVPAQKKPYKPLTEVVKQQPVFEFNNERGTIVGFLLPDYVNGLNVTGFHLHFINSDKTAGGHLIDCRSNGITISIDRKDRFTLLLPDSDEFGGLSLNDIKREDVNKVEH